VHISLSVKDSLSRENLIKFLKANGLDILLKCMNLAFKDLTNEEQSTELFFDERDFDKLNFTRSHSCSELFKRNNRDICMGILSVKILDLIFSTMSEVTTDHSIP
jgi:hypothetical protein